MKVKNKEYPAFGLNFLTNFKNKDKKYLLICGFESFKNVIIRIDILEIICNDHEQ